MKKSACFAAIIVVSLSAATASAQGFVSGTNPRPQFVSGTNPRPQVSAPYSGFGVWFSSLLSMFQL